MLGTPANRNHPVRTILDTERLTLREVEVTDAAFVRELLNEPAWLEHIGDRGVHSDADAETYIRDRLQPSYEANGFGFFAVERAEDCELVGICGIIKRDALDDVDLGFAFLERYWRQGYAFEASLAVIRFARDRIGLTRLVAITSPANAASSGLLSRLGMRFEMLVRLNGEEPELRLYGLQL